MMKAGKYYVGDLCYVLHDRWDEFCSLTINGHRVLDGEFNLADGTRFATYTTMYGDGCYSDEQGNEYGVDAGLIGCVALEDINFNDESNFTSGGRIVEFVKDFTTFSSGGVISFGGVSIDTDPEVEELEEEEY
jgi:hypothetical protein